MQTLKQAVHLAKSGKNKSLSLAAAALEGLPEGGWGETEQAKRQMLDWLPARQEREYSLREFIEALYTVDHAGRYRTRQDEPVAHKLGVDEHGRAVYTLDSAEALQARGIAYWEGTDGLLHTDR